MVTCDKATVLHLLMMSQALSLLIPGKADTRAETPRLKLTTKYHSDSLHVYPLATLKLGLQVLWVAQREKGQKS